MIYRCPRIDNSEDKPMEKLSATVVASDVWPLSGAAKDVPTAMKRPALRAVENGLQAAWEIDDDFGLSERHAALQMIA